jgi:hypothetical protein
MQAELMLILSYQLEYDLSLERGATTFPPRHLK